MDMLRKWCHKNLENIVIAYLAISVALNSIFYLVNTDSISLSYLNLFMIQSVLLILGVGYLLQHYKTKKKINTKGFAYAFLIFSMLTRTATFVNYLLYYTIHNKYNFDFSLPADIYIFPILLIIVVVLSYKKNILEDLVSNKKNRFNLSIVGMYVINKILHIPYRVMIDVSDDNTFTIKYFNEILKNYIDFDGYLVMFISVIVFVIPLMIMFLINSRFNKNKEISTRATILTYTAIIILLGIVGQYALYFYLGIMTGYQRDIIEIFAIIRRIEYIYIALFIILLSIRNRYNN